MAEDRITAALRGPTPTATAEHPKPEFPPDHKPGMIVPKGGSSCSSCQFWESERPNECGNDYFIEWNGSGKLPAPPDQYCSDWWVGIEGTPAEEANETPEEEAEENEGE